MNYTLSAAFWQFRCYFLFLFSTFFVEGRGKKREDDSASSSAAAIAAALSLTGGVMSSQSGGTNLSCGCKASGSSLISGSGAGWEGTALLHHGSYIKLGCLQFVFSVAEYASKQPKEEQTATPASSGPSSTTGTATSTATTASLSNSSTTTLSSTTSTASTSVTPTPTPSTATVSSPSSQDEADTETDPPHKVPALQASSVP